MTVLTLDLWLDERAAILGDDAVSESTEHGGRGRLTLDDVVVGVWEGLAAARPAPCPVCGGTMAPAGGRVFGGSPLVSGAGPTGGSGWAGGRCEDCGSMLS